MLPIWGRAAGQGMVFGLSVLNVDNFLPVCPQQGMAARLSSLKYGLLAVFSQSRLSQS